MSRIMIVDDDDVIAKATMTVLKSRGYDVLAVSSGNECLEKIDSYRPDLVLLDIMMPGISPTEVIAEIRRRGRGAKVVYFSAIKKDSETDRKISAPFISEKDGDVAVDYLEKPFTIGALMEKVRGGIAKK